MDSIVFCLSWNDTFHREKESKKEDENGDNEEDEDGLNAKEKAKKTIEGLKGDISISQEEEMSITGSNARFMIMQKLAMKDKEVGSKIVFDWISKSTEVVKQFMNQCRPAWMLTWS